VAREPLRIAGRPAQINSHFVGLRRWDGNKKGRAPDRLTSAGLAGRAERTRRTVSAYLAIGAGQAYGHTIRTARTTGTRSTAASRGAAVTRAAAGSEAARVAE
jgi:hypothetical protein